MPLPDQRPGDIVVKTALHRNCSVSHPLPARRVQSLLGIHVEVDHVHDNLHMALGLHVAAHDAERSDRPVVLHQKARDDRVVGALAGHQAIDVVRIQREIRASVLQCDAGSVNHDPGSESHIVGLNVGHHIAFPVRAAQVYRSASWRHPMCPHTRFIRHLCSSSGAIFGRQKRMIIDDHPCGIRHKMERIRERHLHGLNLPVIGLGTVFYCKCKFFQNIERHQSCNPLPVGRDLAHIVPSVIDADRIHPKRFVGRQILIAQVTAEFTAFRIYLSRKLSGIKGRRICLTDQRQTSCVVR